MLKAFTRNYEDNSTEAGYQFTFYCDICNDGYKSSFIESTAYKKNRGLKSITRGASVLGGLFGGVVSELGYSMERGGNILSERFEEMSPLWQKEHEAAFEKAMSEAKPHFHKCHSCHQWVCHDDFNEEEGLCVQCAPRQEIYVAKAKSKAMQRNIDEASDTATVWEGKIESKTTICSKCGKPAGSGKYCNNCGASMALNTCANCGTENAHGVKFCKECGNKMENQPITTKCRECGATNSAGTKFCAECGTKLNP